MQTAKSDPSLLQSARMTEVGERFNRTLFAALDALEESKIEYALIGGVASSGLGRPRSTHDIDIFVRPEDAGATLDSLNRHEFRTEKTDFNWLFKGWKEDILVDIIFKSRGDIYFDQEMAERTKRIEYHGRKVRTVAPEDLIIIKAAVHDEIGPHHWHDALAVLSHAQIDWDYLFKRARRAPRRLLALLMYAQSNDIWVPNRVVFDLFRTVYGDSNVPSHMQTVHSPSFSLHGERPSSDNKVSSRSGASDAGAQSTRPSLVPSSGQSADTPQTSSYSAGQRRTPDQYLAARLKDALTQDSRGGDQDIKINVQDNRVLLRGEVLSEEHRTCVEQVVRDHAPGFQVENQLKVQVLSAPETAEDVG